MNTEDVLEGKKLDDRIKNPFNYHLHLAFKSVIMTSINSLQIFSAHVSFHHSNWNDTARPATQVRQFRTHIEKIYHCER